MGPASDPAEESDIPPKMRAHAFQFRPVWQRFLVVLAGPVANFLLAILIFAAFFMILGAPPDQCRRTGPAGQRGGRGRARSRATGSSAIAGRVDREVRRYPLGRHASRRANRDRAIRARRRPVQTVAGHARRGHDHRPVRPDIRTRAARRLPVHRPRWSGSVRLEALPEAVGYTWRITVAMVDGLGQIIAGDRRHRRCRRADQDRPDRRAAGQPRLACRSSSCSPCSQLISDSSTSCQSRCWMAAILLSMPWKRFGGARSAQRATGMGVSRRAGPHSCPGGVHDGQRSWVGWPVGSASTLDWLGGVGAGAVTRAWRHVRRT